MASRARKRWQIFLGAIAILLAAGGVALALLNPRLTRFVEGEAFRAELEKQTAKGLHFASGRFAPIRRTGFFSAATDGFQAENGRKALTSLEAQGVSARFNPLGVFLRRWQLDELHVARGKVGIQIYEPKPEPSPAKPWFHIFMPDRVYLKRVWSEPVDVTWRLRDEEAGFFGARLLITPHGRDFEYRATGGTMKMALIPDLQLRHTHMLITKELFSLYQLDLASGEGSIHGEGTAGMRDDKSVDFKIQFGELPIREWVPRSWKEVGGAASGDAHWRGQNLKLEAGEIAGSLRVSGGVLGGLPFLEQLGALTQKRSIERLDLNECSLDLEWARRKGEIKNIAIEDKGKFRIEGSVSVDGKSLGGAIQLGVTREYLEWLPKAEEVFSREHAGYLWTTVRLSGTLDAPGQDLSPRILAALKETPVSFFGVILRQLGEWLGGAGRE